jgi:hypothetical protein
MGLGANIQIDRNQKAAARKVRPLCMSGGTRTAGSNPRCDIKI